MIAGVDGYTHRSWIAAIELADRSTKVELIESFGALLRRDELTLIVIDVPIGLLDVGSRRCDVIARKLVGRRRSSVYPAPIRKMLGAVDYEDACRRRYEVEQKKCSVQLFAILPTIYDVDAQLVPQTQSRVREGHPELSFALLNGGSPMTHAKRRPQGRDERLALLVRQFPDIHRQTGVLALPAAGADVVDAYALLWTARRVRDGTARVIPDSPQYDGRGLRVEMVG